MTEEQLNKEAADYAKQFDPIYQIAISNGFKAGYRSRDKEVEEKDNEIQRLRSRINAIHVAYEMAQRK